MLDHENHGCHEKDFCRDPGVEHHCQRQCVFQYITLGNNVLIHLPYKSNGSATWYIMCQMAQYTDLDNCLELKWSFPTHLSNITLRDNVLLHLRYISNGFAKWYIMWQMSQSTDLDNFLEWTWSFSPHLSNITLRDNLFWHISLWGTMSADTFPA